MRRTFTLILMACFILLGNNVYAERIKDLTTVKGVRSNDLIGYGLVVGLNGTGDSSTASPYTINSINTMLERFGVNIRAQIASMRPKNIAAVMVTATLPAFARAGQKLDITISSIGDAKSLRGGTLLMTPLLAGNNRVYAVAQGSISVGSITASGTSGSKTINHPTVGRIPNGANIERPAPSIMETGQDKVTLMLNTPDFTTVRRIQDAINRDFHMDMAHAIDAGTIEVWNPEGNVIDLLARLEQIEVSSDHQATVIIDERTGTIVMGQDVRIDTVAVAHGSISVNISDTAAVSQPNAFSDGSTKSTTSTDIQIKESQAKLVVLPKQVSLSSLITALNAVGATPSDLIAVLQAIKAAGALHARLKII